MNGIYNDIGADDYSAVAAELSGADDEDIVAGLGLNMIESGLGSGLGSGIGFDGEDAIEGLSDDELGAVIRRKIQASRGKAASQKELLALRRQLAALRKNQQGFALLNRNVGTPQGAFGLSGSLNLVTFTGTVTAGGSQTVSAQLDRRSTIRQMRCDEASGVLKVSSFTAAGLPFAALRFPFSLSSFMPASQTSREIKPITLEASTTFNLIVSNSSGADVELQLELWGTAG